MSSLRQFKVRCEEKCLEIQLRLRSEKLWHFVLKLEPLCHEIIPEDTVPRLRGKDAKRRLEASRLHNCHVLVAKVKLFKRVTWMHQDHGSVL